MVHFQIIKRRVELILSFFFLTAASAHVISSSQLEVFSRLMQYLILAIYLKLTLLLFLPLVSGSADCMSLLTLHELHQVGSLLLCDFLVIYFLQAISCQDDYLVAIFLNGVHWIFTQVQLF